MWDRRPSKDGRSQTTDSLQLKTFGPGRNALGGAGATYGTERDNYDNQSGTCEQETTHAVEE